MMLKIKRAYESKEIADGTRILIDRLWPRGVSKARAGIDAWLKDLAPSTELRQWYGHDPGRWDEFRRRYIAELSAPEKTRLINDLAHQAANGTVTLVYGARDTEHSDVKVLEELITGAMAGKSGHQ